MVVVHRVPKELAAINHRGVSSFLTLPDPIFQPNPEILTGA
jgi:hypothetical protein